MEEQDWSRFFGRNVDYVIDEIRAEDSSLNVVKIKEGSPVTRDYRFDRVRVFYNEADLVTSIPTRG